VNELNRRVIVHGGTDPEGRGQGEAVPSSEGKMVLYALTAGGLGLLRSVLEAERQFVR
jgi:hypothetical protein